MDSHRELEEAKRVAEAPGGFVKRRLSDRIELAFDQACDQGQAEVAACMLKGLDLALLGRPIPWERRQAALTLLRQCQTRLQALRDAQATTVADAPEGSRPGLPTNSAELAATAA